MRIVRSVRFPLLFVFLLLAAGLLAPYAAAGTQYTGASALGWRGVAQAVLTASDGGSYDYFGHGVAVDGDTAIIGACGHYESGVEGAAYVFVRVDGEWKFKQKLVAGDGGSSDWFGAAVDLDGANAIIGAPYKQIGLSVGQGAAYIFTRAANGTWSQTQRLVAGDGATDDGFGTSVGIDGGLAVIGAPKKRDAGHIDQGAAYVYALVAGSWSQQAKLSGSTASATDEFGCSVAVSGTTALVGAYKDQVVPGVLQHGSAFVFTGSAGSWTEQQHLYEADGAEADHFGTAVALDGDTALIGVPDGDVPGATVLGEGYALVYQRSGGTWAEARQLTASDGDGGQNFGASAALDGDKAVLGMPRLAVNGVDGLGAAYTFTRAAGVWSQSEKLTMTGSAYEHFGTAVALSGATTVVGVPDKAMGGNDEQGAAYVFGGGPTARPQVGKPVCPASARPRAKFFVRGSLSPAFPAGSKTIVVGAYRNVAGKWKLYKKYAAVNSGSGAVSSYSAKVSLPVKGKYRFLATSKATAEWLSATSAWSRTLTVR